MWTPGRIGGGRGSGRMGNSKQREAGEMNGGNYVTIPFKKKGGEAGNAKYGRRELSRGSPPPFP